MNKSEKKRYFDFLNKDKCVPNSGDSFTNKEYSLFVDDKYTELYSPKEAKKLGIKPYDTSLELTQEGRDWIDEMPVIVIKKGAMLVHQTVLDTIINKSLQLNTTEACWWEKFYPGHRNYGGGWFTYGTEYGGPSFGLALQYEVKKDVALLFIPNKYTSLKDKKKKPYKFGKLSIDEDPSHYFDNEVERGYSFQKFISSTEGYAGSHVIEGVRDWKEKGYKKLTHEYFADELGKRLAVLGINGYVSCDENEVFLSHRIMTSGVISHPSNIYITEEGMRGLPRNKLSSVIKFIINYCTPQRSTLQITEEKHRNVPNKALYIDIINQDEDEEGDVIM